MNVCEHHAAKFAATASNMAAKQASWTSPASQHALSPRSQQCDNGKCLSENRVKALL